jgi:hypothetical protein
MAERAFKAGCGCEAHLINWSSKIKVLTIKHCRLHKATPALLAAAKDAEAHIAELEEAWHRGSISSWDGQDGTRSDRNASVGINLRSAIAAAEEGE